ncbi:MAG TPA: alanine racemase, partial [Ktedonobacterales bacterium]|nr:alanine racemase [Ktedonobacterales bacterium]
DAEVLAPGGSATCEGFAHDSRTVTPGECFVAVRGMHGDGHDYALDALERGAGALLLERGRLPALAATVPGLVEHARAAGAAVLAVEDTREALKAYGAHILRQWQPTVIAVAGSAGKTTTKEAIADVLGTLAPTFRSWRNYNDLLGLPLSLGRLEPTHRYAVVELGADHPGEIADLCALARPHAGVVTNVSPAHLQYFGGVETLGTELSRLPALLPPDGLAILNGDDPATRAMAALTAAPTRFFGLTDKADERPSYALEPLGSREPLALALRPTGQLAGEPIVFPHLHGDHWAYAVLAALAVGAAFGVEPDAVRGALRPLCPLPGRMRWLDGMDDLVLLDDSHNATPASAAAGLRTLHAIATRRGARAIAVLGDMLRMGDAEEHEHRQLGRIAAACAEYLVTRGPCAQIIADEAIQRGLPTERVAVTLTAEDAARAVADFAGVGETRKTGETLAVVYIKGSEELRMEQVTLALLAHPEAAEQVLDRQTQAWRRVVVMRPDRPTWLEVDLSAIGQNTRLTKALVGPDIQVLASLKADAYGHGALRVARTVLHNGASWLGVATVSEAEPLRAAGITSPILVFGYTAPWQAREAVRLDLRVTIYAMESAQALARATRDLDREVRVHVKIDTGMARLGLRTEDIPAIVEFFAALRELPGLVVEGVFTHFATADSTDQTYARRQLERFHAVLAALEERGLRPPLVHAANSAAMLALPEARFDMVRPGVAIYGLAPSAEVRLPEGFRPAL